MFLAFPLIPLSVCVGCFHTECVSAHHRLFGDVHQVLEAVKLVLLEGREEHVQHHLPLRSHHLPLRLLLLLERHLHNHKLLTPNTETTAEVLRGNCQTNRKLSFSF